jgi:hypothetical protein
VPDIKTHDQLLREAKGKGRGQGASEEKIRKTLDPNLIASLNGLSKPKEADPTDQGHQQDRPIGHSDRPIGQTNWTLRQTNRTDQSDTQTDQPDCPTGQTN